MKYGYEERETFRIEHRNGGVISDRMYDFFYMYGSVMKRKTITENEIEIINMYAEMMTEMQEKVKELKIR